MMRSPSTEEFKRPGSTNLQLYNRGDPAVCIGVDGV